jgi:ubiquinone/menaquinone biosynthesis C-methylase UbiE
VVTPRLIGVAERMEEPAVEAPELARTLLDLARINRLFGATGAILRHLPALLPASDRPLRLLDVATGYADIPRAIVRWARRRPLPLQIDALDHHAGIRRLALAANRQFPEIRLCGGDALALPLADDSVDVALASQVLHHMEGGDPVRLLRELYRVARHGVLVSDLARGVWRSGVTRVALSLASRSPIIRHDGPLSIRRGFRSEELVRLARDAGWRAPRVAAHPFFRLILTERKG